MLQQIQGRVFLREPKRRRQLRHSRKGLGGPEIVKTYKIRKIHAPKSRGVFFLREPKRRRQLRHTCKGLGIPRPTIIVAFRMEI